MTQEPTFLSDYQGKVLSSSNLGLQKFLVCFHSVTVLHLSEANVGNKYRGFYRKRGFENFYQSIVVATKVQP